MLMEELNEVVDNLHNQCESVNSLTRKYIRVPLYLCGKFDFRGC